ncbi:hypothetical protein BBP40_003537 [Aspergillus hancockii]|nr:hypothetical protein BBP40_003537 [Aspergillus hancockii]
MLIAVAPGSPKTAQAIIRALLKTDRTVHVKGVYRDLSRVPAEFLAYPNFQAVKGDVDDAATLDFAGVDAVLAITPPRYDGSDSLVGSRIASENTKLAVQKSGSVKRLVLLSSMGAEHPSGTGEIMTNHIAETILKDAAPEVVLARCGYIMENWAAAVETVKSKPPHFYSVITPLNFEVPMVATKDIGEACAAYLLTTQLPESPHIVDVLGPRTYSSQDVQKAFQDATGRDVELRPVEKEDLPEFFGAFLPKSAADGFVEMTISFLPGGVIASGNEDAASGVQVYRGKTELGEAIREICEGSGGCTSNGGNGDEELATETSNSDEESVGAPLLSGDREVRARASFPEHLEAAAGSQSTDDETTGLPSG